MNIAQPNTETLTFIISLICGFGTKITRHSMIFGCLKILYIHFCEVPLEEESHTAAGRKSLIACTIK